MESSAGICHGHWSSSVQKNDYAGSRCLQTQLLGTWVDWTKRQVDWAERLMVLALGLRFCCFLLCLFFFPTSEKSGEKGYPGKSLHATIAFPNSSLLPTKFLALLILLQILPIGDLHTFIPVCFTLALQKTPKHTRNEVTGSCPFFSSTGFASWLQSWRLSKHVKSCD